MSANVILPNVDNEIKSDLERTESFSQLSALTNKSDQIYTHPIFPLPMKEVYNYNLAATLIRDARYGRVQIPYKEDKRNLSLYELYYNKWLQSFYYLFMFINLGLVLFEEPSSFNFHSPIFVILIINLICLGYFFFRWYHHFYVSDLEKFLKKRLNLVTPIILFVMLADMLIYTTLRYLNFKYKFQITRCLRPLLLVTYPENFKLRSALRNIWVTALDISTVFALFIFMLAFFAIVSFQFFRTLDITQPDGTKYFGNFFESMFQLYVLVTTSNSPDVIVPALEQSGFYIIIYLFVTIICNWILIGIIVASVYNAYKTHLGQYVIHNVAAKKSKLRKAFMLLKKPDETISLTGFISVMQYVDPQNSYEKNCLLFRLLDIDKSDSLSLTQFSKLTEFIHLNFTEIPITRDYFKRFIPKCYWCYMSRVNQFFVKLIRHRYTKLFFEMLIVVNAVTIVVFTDTKFELMFEWIFTLIFTGEIILRIFATGINIYVRTYWNIFDMVVISLALLSLILQMTMMNLINQYSSLYLKFLLSMRILRILKLITIIKEFRLIMNCIILLIPSLSYYAAIQISIYYIYTCIGMEVFSDLYNPPFENNYKPKLTNQSIDCGNKNLIGSDFLLLHYCIFNFNSAYNGFLLMLILTVSNNWHILLTGLALILGKAVRLFFISIHMICVLLVMNIVLAFIIDAYLMEIESSKGKYEEFIEQRLRDLNLSVTEVLEKLGIKHFGTQQFDLTYEVLNKVFPKNVDNNESTLETKVCFALAEGVPKSLDALLQRMFHDDIMEAEQEYGKFSYSMSAIATRRSLPANTEAYINSDRSLWLSENKLNLKGEPVGDSLQLNKPATNNTKVTEQSQI